VVTKEEQHGVIKANAGVCARAGLDAYRNGMPIRIQIERAVTSACSPCKDLRRSRSARPDELILTTLRPLASSRSSSPRSFASSQTGSLGHEVRHASITSS
jgi:hypothetical protein